MLFDVIQDYLAR